MGTTSATLLPQGENSELGDEKLPELEDEARHHGKWRVCVCVCVCVCVRARARSRACECKLSPSVVSDFVQPYGL